MRALSLLLAALSISDALAAEPDTYPTWEAFAEARNGECLGGPGTLATPVEVEAGGHRYQILGDRLVQQDQDQDSSLRIGVISATKDEREETLAAIAKLIAQLKRRKIDLLVVNGDVGSKEFNMEEALLPALAKAGVLVLAHVGNTESCGQFNRAVAIVSAKQKNLINGNWVRRLELDDGVLFTLPGYHDKRFVHTSGAAHYKEEDLFALKEQMDAAKGVKVLIAHGPPKQSGKKALDLTTDAGNVGDPQITDLLKRTKTSFGIFGHILEAGGRGTDLAGKERKPKKWHPALYVNAGTANPDPWQMLDGKTSEGMGLYFELKGKKATFEVLRP